MIITELFAIAGHLDSEERAEESLNKFHAAHESKRNLA